MKVVDIAAQIYAEQGYPTDTSIASIAYWLRTNTGKLNTVLYENFFIDLVTQEIVNNSSPLWANQSSGSIPGTYEINHIAAAILVAFYKIYRIELDIRSVVTGIGLDTVLEARDKEFSVKKINKSEVLKTLVGFKKDTLKEVQELVHNYRSYYAAPGQIAGNDDQSGLYNSVFDEYPRNNIGNIY